MALAALGVIAGCQPQDLVVEAKVDLAARPLPISPWIYGSNQPNWPADRGRFGVVRFGGNRSTAYNWENNASNAGGDWQHQSDDYLGGGDTPGEVPRSAMARAAENGADFITTLQMAGYVAADKLADGDVNKTPDYLQVRFRRSVPRKPGPFVYPPNLTDDAVYMDEYLVWLRSRLEPGRKLAVCLDNEPDLWHDTHARIHPEKVTFAELIAKSIDYASAVKSAAPDVQVFGPVSYGWHGFQTLQDAPDQNGRNWLDTYLAAFRQAEADHSRRLLDVMNVHWYPEARGGGKRIVFGEEVPGMAEARVQAPRSLWDATYREDSWIQESLGDEPIRLIPRLRAQVAAHYPETKVGITEYFYGGGEHISGALAQADALGVFAREGLYAATLWKLQDKVPFIDAAFDVYRNYDGNGAGFGGAVLPASVSNDAAASLYAGAEGQKVVLVAINKTGARLALNVSGVDGLKPARAFVLNRSKPQLVETETPTSAGSLVVPSLSVLVVECMR